MGFKLKTRTMFPAQVEVTSPVTLVKDGAIYTFGFDPSGLSGTYQDADATLTALAALNSTAGLLTQTGADAFTKRTLTGTANEITVTNGDGAAGAPTLSLPAAMTFTGKTVTGGAFTGLSSLSLSNNQNAQTTVSVSNTTNGASALAGTLVTNGTVIGGFSVASATFSTTILQSRVYMVQTGGDGIVIINLEADPILFGISGVEVGRWSSVVPGRLIAGLSGTTTGSIDFSGATSGATTLTASATGSGTLTLPAATDTLVGKATTDALTNKTFNTAATGNVFQINGVGVTANTGTGAVVRAASPQITTPDIIGTAAVGNANAGSVGEFIQSIIASGSAVSLTSGTGVNLTSISLTAGDWDVWAIFMRISAATTNVTQLLSSLSLVSGTISLLGDRSSATTYQSSGIVPGAAHMGSSMIQTRFNVSSTTTVYAVIQDSFSVSTLTGWGSLQARRVR
jgi:hypothetical protein